MTSAHLIIKTVKLNNGKKASIEILFAEAISTACSKVGSMHLPSKARIKFLALETDNLVNVLVDGQRLAGAYLRITPDGFSIKSGDVWSEEVLITDIKTSLVTIIDTSLDLEVLIQEIPQIFGHRELSEGFWTMWQRSLKSSLEGEGRQVLYLPFNFNGRRYLAIESNTNKELVGKLEHQAITNAIKYDINLSSFV